MGINNKANTNIQKQIEQKILIKAYNMKLQFICLASTLAVTFSRNVPVPSLNQKTEKNLQRLSNNAINKAQQLLADNGVTVDLSGKIQNAANAGKPQLKAIGQKANQELNKISNTYGSWDLSQAIDTVFNKVNSKIDQQEASAPDLAKTLMDAGQQVLGAVKDAGINSLGDKKDLTLNQLVNAASGAAQKAVNNQQVNQALRKANKAVNEA